MDVIAPLESLSSVQLSPHGEVAPDLPLTITMGGVISQGIIIGDGSPAVSTIPPLLVRAAGVGVQLGLYNEHSESVEWSETISIQLGNPICCAIRETASPLIQFGEKKAPKSCVDVIIVYTSGLATFSGAFVGGHFVLSTPIFCSTPMHLALKILALRNISLFACSFCGIDTVRVKVERNEVRLLSFTANVLTKKYVVDYGRLGSLVPKLLIPPVRRLRVLLGFQAEKGTNLNRNNCVPAGKITLKKVGQLLQTRYVIDSSIVSVLTADDVLMSCISTTPVTIRIPFYDEDEMEDRHKEILIGGNVKHVSMRGKLVAVGCLYHSDNKRDSKMSVFVSRVTGGTSSTCTLVAVISGPDNDTKKNDYPRPLISGNLCYVDWGNMQTLHDLSLLL